jgi:LysR family transcriptional regulator, regulator for genes of the gallate degradation pathway
MYGLDSEREAISVSLRHLKLFESVARLSSVRRASEECHLSQPAVTQAIAKLEDQIGASLLERGASGSYLNPLGVIFHRRIERLFAQIEEALVELGVPVAHAPVMASRITRSQIRSLIAIVENGSFAQAARALDVSPATLSRAARDLESDLRRPLYQRTASGIAATSVGGKFARKLKLATREIDWGIEELDSAKGSLRGQIVIGAMQLAGSFLLASVLNEFIATHPHATVRIWNGSSGAMLRSLRGGDVDVVIGLLRNPVPEDLVEEALAEAPYVIAARRGHPLFKKRKVTLDDLAAYDWVVGTPGACRRVCFDSLFEGRRRPTARVETSSLPTIRLVLARSDCLTLFTSYELMYEDDALAAIPYGPIEPVPSIGVTTRTDWLPTQLQVNFLRLIRKEMTTSLTPVKELRRAS